MPAQSTTQLGLKRTKPVLASRPQPRKSEPYLTTVHQSLVVLKRLQAKARNLVKVWQKLGRKLTSLLTGIDEQFTGVKDMEVLVACVVVEPISKSGKVLAVVG